MKEDDGPKFIKLLEKKGRFASVVSIDHLDELAAEIQSLNKRGLLRGEIVEAYSNSFFNSHLPRSLPNAKSVIIVSTPQPKVRVGFHLNGETHRLIIPPTYFDAYKVTYQARQLLAEAFKPETHRLVRAALPIKLLAVRSGLAMYGRNNVTYIPRHGSFHRLTAFYSDYDSPVDYWQEKRVLPACEKCRACLKACPTEAIVEDRFLIHAEKCLTFLNEKKSSVDFPSSLERSAHTCLIGCLQCQRVCPYNKNSMDWIEDRGTFSEAETAYLLKGKFTGTKAKKMDAKLKRLGLDLTIFPRNLEVLVGRGRSA